jgi:hypothetical protein
MQSKLGLDYRVWRGHHKNACVSCLSTGKNQFSDLLDACCGVQDPSVVWCRVCQELYANALAMKLVLAVAPMQQESSSSAHPPLPLMDIATATEATEATATGATATGATAMQLVIAGDSQMEQDVKGGPVMDEAKDVSAMQLAVTKFRGKHKKARGTCQEFCDQRPEEGLTMHAEACNYFCAHCNKIRPAGDRKNWFRLEQHTETQSHRHNKITKNKNVMVPIGDIEREAASPISNH